MPFIFGFLFSGCLLYSRKGSLRSVVAWRS